MPDTACACQIVLITPAMAARGQDDEASSSHRVDRCNLVSKSSGMNAPVALSAGMRSAKQPNRPETPIFSRVGLSGVSPLTSGILPVAKAWSATSAGPSAIIRVRPASAIASRSSAPNWPPSSPSRAPEAVLASKEQRQAFLQLILVGRQKAGHPAVMVEMAVAQHQGVDASRIDAEDRQIVEQRLRRISEIDENIARSSPRPDCACMARPHSAWSARRPGKVRRRVEARALDLEPIERPRGRERRQPVIDHHPNGQPIDSRDGSKQVRREPLGQHQS